MEQLDSLTAIVLWSHLIGRVVAREAGSTTPAAQWRALSTLIDGGPMRLGELAAECRVTQPGMTRLVAQMVGHGLVERGQDPHDERVVVIAATEAGREARAAWIRTIQDTLAPKFADLSAEEWQAIATAAALIAARTPTLIGVSK